MIALSSPLRGHKKESSTDSLNSLNSQRKRRFLSVVSSEQPQPPQKAPVHLRKISQLKKQAMGELTNRPEEQKTGIQLKIKRVSTTVTEKPILEKGVAERMVQFKKKLAFLGDSDEWGSQKENAGESKTRQRELQTPINRLLFESSLEE